MTSANSKLLSIVGTFLLICAYFTYVFYDHQEQETVGIIADAKKINEKKKNFIENSNVDAVVFGGSNALFSISAESLSQKTTLNWYNFSVMNEGSSDSNYRNYVNQAFSEARRRKIIKVVYSSIYFYNANDIEKRKENTRGISGEIKVLKPEYSFLNFMNSFVQKEKQRREFKYAANEYGDFDFQQFNCKLNELSKNFNISMLDKEKAVLNLVENFYFYAEKFPNADINIVTPSVYVGSKFDKLDEFNRSVAALVKDKVNRDRPDLIHRIKIIIQPSFPTLDYICDDGHHANEHGRIFRTNDLLMKL
jgi:hypothetical protein